MNPYGLGQTASGIEFYNVVSMPEKFKMENKSEKLKTEGKRNQSPPEPVKIAGVVYGTKSLRSCMEEVMKLYMEK